MRRFIVLAALLASCIHRGGSIDGGALGRVVVYRNGVAFYERRATAHDGKLAVHVPRDRVDDFLKSLTVVDPTTRRPLSVSIPRREDGGNTLTMMLDTRERRASDVLLTYVTEAAAWKPSYRVVVGPTGKVMLEGWAIVDNLSGEDWNDVQVGVGASSALAFRYDLWSVRRVDREMLQTEEKFALAPPTGMSPYPETAGAGGEEEIATIGGGTSVENTYVVDGASTTGVSSSTTPHVDGMGEIQGIVRDKKTGEPLAGVTVIASSPALGVANAQTAITDDKGRYTMAELMPGDYKVTFFYADITIEANNVHVAKDGVTPVYQTIDQSKAGGEVIQIRAEAPRAEQTSMSQGITLHSKYNNDIPVAGRTFDSALGAAAGSSSGAPPPPPDPDAPIRDAAARILKAHKDALIEAHGATAAEATARANQVRDKLVDEGVPAKHVHVRTKIGANETAATRVLAIAASAAAAAEAPPAAHTAAGPSPDTPVGESHFIAERPMTVPSGASAMVAVVHAETEGGVVYLYDPISERGDARYAFKAVRVANPTGDTLEPGPVTVYGDGRFIGEGITEPVPPHAPVVVPFALDRQIVVTRHDDEQERIARLVTAERGVVTAELQRRREAKFTVTSRLATPTTVYLRYRLEEGFKLVAAPSAYLHVGDSQLFAVELAAGETKYVTIAEAAPVERALDLQSDQAMAMLRLFVDEPAATPALKAQLAAVLATHREAAEVVDKIRTRRDQLAELQAREGELHAQLVTLKAVRTGGELMATLKAKLAETSDRVQKATVSIVDAQEQLMLLRVKLASQLAELHVTDQTAALKP